MKKLKIFSAAVCCVMLLTACGGKRPAEQTNAPTEFVESSSDISEVSEVPSVPSEPNETSSTPSEPLHYTDNRPLCTAYALYCVEDDFMIDSMNKDKLIAPASLTKVLTASVVLRYSDPEDVVTVGSELSLVNEDSSLCMISRGQRLTVYDLLTGLLLPSGNDAAYTLAVSTARRVSGDPDMPDRNAVELFCKMMNEMARELGMKSSHFADPDGWDDPAHYTTVSDLIKVTKYALTVPEIREIVATPEKYVVFETGESITWYNANLLLHERSDYYNEYAIGMKNGATDDAGYCLIAVFEKNGKTYIDIVVGSESIEDRYEMIDRLFREIP